MSETPAAQVALIEAGPMDDAPECIRPLRFPQLSSRDHDWDYSSEPEPALSVGRIYCPRGKLLGGCSSMERMIYMRGNRRGLRRMGAGGRRVVYDELLPYLSRAETNERGASRLPRRRWALLRSGRDGPSIHYRSHHTRFVQAATRVTDDFNGASQLGAGHSKSRQQRKALQCGTAYLRPSWAGEP